MQPAGGADVLGRPKCGRLTVGKRADIAIWDVSGVESAGSWDPAVLVLFGPNKVRGLFVEGRFVVRDGQLCSTDLETLFGHQNRLV